MSAIAWLHQRSDTIASRAASGAGASNELDEPSRGPKTSVPSSPEVPCGLCSRRCRPDPSRCGCAIVHSEAGGTAPSGRGYSIGLAPAPDGWWAEDDVASAVSSDRLSLPSRFLARFLVRDVSN